MSFVGSTQPGDGAAARVVVDAPSWKEKVVGYAKKTRGTMLRRVCVCASHLFTPCSDFCGCELGQRETKEHGEKILEGQATVSDINQVPDRSSHQQ